MNGAESMREIARLVQSKVDGLGFCVLVFEMNKPGIGNYIANCERKSMIEALRETADRLDKNADYPTMEEN